MNKCDTCIKTDNLVLKALYLLTSHKFKTLLYRYGQGLTIAELAAHYSISTSRAQLVVERAFSQFEHNARMLGVSVTYELLIKTLENNKKLMPFFKEQTSLVVDEEAIKNIQRETLYEASPIPSKEELLAEDISYLQLTNRDDGWLRRSNIKTISQLINYSEEDLLALPKIGLGAIRSIKESLRELGLCLKNTH